MSQYTYVPCSCTKAQLLKHELDDLCVTCLEYHRQMKTARSGIPAQMLSFARSHRLTVMYLLKATEDELTGGSEEFPIGSKEKIATWLAVLFTEARDSGYF